MFIHMYTPLAGGQENHLQSKGFLGRAFGAYESGYRLVLPTHFLAKFTFPLCYPKGSHSPGHRLVLLTHFCGKIHFPILPSLVEADVQETTYLYHWFSMHSLLWRFTLIIGGWAVIFTSWKKKHIFIWSFSVTNSLNLKHHIKCDFSISMLCSATITFHLR